MTNDEWKEQCKVVEMYLTDRFDIDVIYEYGAEDCYEYDDKKIFINSASRGEKRFYYLLHEAGHAVSHKASLEEDAVVSLLNYVPCTNFWMSSEHSDGRRARKKSHRVSVVMDEIDAWRYGLGIAAELELYVDNDRYDKFVAKNLFNYMCWAVD